MPELAVMAVPINVLVAEHLSEVRDVDFQARPIDAGEARHEHTVHRCRGIGSVAGIGAQQSRHVDPPPRRDGLHGLAVAQAAIVAERDGLLNPPHVRKRDVAIERMRQESS